MEFSKSRAPFRGRGLGEKPFNPMKFSKSGAPFRAWVLGASGTAGGYNAPGLPEIFGTTGYDAQSGYSGAFYSGASTYGQAGTGGTRQNLSFKASLCNPSYGASDTVMPSSVNIPVILYLGRPK